MSRTIPRELTPTEAVLSQAAALTTAEAHQARMCLMARGSAVLTPLDTSGLLSGDGTAGRLLLGGVPYAEMAWSCARRSTRIQTREARTPEEAP